MLKSLLRNLLARAGSRPDAAAPAAGPNIEQAASRALAELLGLDRTLERPPDYERIARIVASVEAARYMVERMQTAANLTERGALLDHALRQATLDGLVLEFGVYQGASLRFIAQRTSALVHGFDSFQGLPEDWTHFQRRGRFSLEGRVPQFDEPNIRIHDGLFGDTLGPFLEENTGPVRFLHVDCDLYSSTREVLEILAERIVPGTVIVFDEYINFPGWQRHEYRAFQEFVADHGRSYRYTAFASAYMSVAVQIE
jgi:predicted O-methyltransferase YrrM